MRHWALAAWKAANARRDPVAPLEPIGLHEARRTCASVLIASGANPKVIQTMMGHATINMTFDQYGHLMPGGLEDSAAKANAYLGHAPIAPAVCGKEKEARGRAGLVTVLSGWYPVGDRAQGRTGQCCECLSDLWLRSPVDERSVASAERICWMRSVGSDLAVAGRAGPIGKTQIAGYSGGDGGGTGYM